MKLMHTRTIILPTFRMICFNRVFMYELSGEDDGGDGGGVNMGKDINGTQSNVDGNASDAFVSAMGKCR